jgi:hypothetical protein
MWQAKLRIHTPFAIGPRPGNRISFNSGNSEGRPAFVVACDAALRQEFAVVLQTLVARSSRFVIANMTEAEAKQATTNTSHRLHSGIFIHK